jgi:hypothetical protein
VDMELMEIPTWKRSRCGRGYWVGSFGFLVLSFRYWVLSYRLDSPLQNWTYN